jgi:ubiquinone/menaquinone biosynthesis C-methylase UbiE
MASSSERALPVSVRAGLATSATSCSFCRSNAFHQIARARDYIYHGSAEYLTVVTCHVCSHVYLNPQPTIDALPLMYPADYGTFSTKFRGRTNLLAQIKNAVNLKRFRSVAGRLKPGMRVLDVGCGNGELLRLLASKQTGLELWGLDWHFPIETRRDLEFSGIHLLEGTLEAIPIQQGFFDCVLMYQLIEHLWEPQECLNKVANSLCAGGIIAIETPDTDGYDRALFSSGTWGGYYIPRHLNLYNFERLAEMLRRAGLQVMTQKSLPAPVIWCYSLQASLQERFGAGTTIAALFNLKNIAALAGFTLLDLLAIAAGFKSSNQQAVARKPFKD